LTSSASSSVGAGNFGEVPNPPWMRSKVASTESTATRRSGACSAWAVALEVMAATTASAVSARESRWVAQAPASASSTSRNAGRPSEAVGGK